MNISAIKTIKVAGYVYTIRLDMDDALRGSDSSGFNDEATGEIHILSSLGPQSRRQTLLHEVVHCVVTSYCSGAGDIDEGVIEGISQGVNQVLRDNPKLVKFLTAPDAEVSAC